MVDLHIVVSPVGCWVVWRRRPSSSTGRDQAGAHTLEPTYQSELLGSGSRAWLSSQAWVTPSHLIIHNTVSSFFYTFPSPIPREKEVYTDWACCCVVKCQQRSFSELGCSFVEGPAAHVTKRQERILPICINAVVAGIPPHLSTTICHPSKTWKNAQQMQYWEFP